MPVAIRGQLIATTIGFLTGPLADGSNKFERLDGISYLTTMKLGFGVPLEDEAHAYYDRPTAEEFRKLAAVRPRLA